MFKSLRKKFIATAVGSVAVVIAILAIALNFINFNKLEERIDTTLLDASRSQALIKIFAEDGDDLVITKNSSSATEYNGFSIAKVDNNGRIIKAYRDDSLIEDQDTLQSKVIEALEKGKTSGFIGSYRFLKVETNVGNLILFLNCQRELDSYESFVKNSVLISIGVILSVLVLIILISKKVIAPIQETYLKQKQFITGASHELKTPLAIISSNADVLEMMNGDSKWTTNIHNQVDRLTSLVNSLVVFSRMEEKDTVERTSFDLTETLKSRIEDFDELANFQKKYIVTDIDENLNYYGEKDSIIQLMDILLENAIKYAPEDSDILVKLNKNRKYATLKVSNKANVEKGDLSKVFDRFYRLDESRNSAIKGYGIGLSMAQLIAEKHKETIQAYAPEDGVFKIEVRFTLVDR
ncbi:sensor histidine kinase [Gemella haemolysans]|mgnify:FL=1|uniref:histidine kinase n=1 Tax=Gemella haemolysans ATCC 10379 TaxID=546270 RepID=C5NV45_9BACL|nr:HAMP domain-containing sensor histidine kinase [Gemella haemolysans]EER68887.1 ATPase/histidine kinase/DNA gyrase B/HSP90 domain protein [Gemella haemolysans ATCC 10379]KAA8707051.1 HAMP domain-containing histidine kinase [Gemella haemolysans]UBH81919.1 HAMP domain-containing histidine kinase [Gemella haemolysans]VEI38164.1 Sensor histidine kinase YycG [Gemella haemolysans]